MSSPFDGLRMAARVLGLQPAAAGNVAEIVAAMSDEDRGLMLAELGAKPNADDGKPPEPGASDGAAPPAPNADGKPPEASTPPAPTLQPAAEDPLIVAARAEGETAGATTQLDRCLTVMRSEHFAGRVALAADLLEGGMAADKIVSALAKAPKGDSNAMLAGLATTENPKLGAGAEGAGGKADIKAGWDRTVTRLNSAKGNKSA